MFRLLVPVTAAVSLMAFSAPAALAGRCSDYSNQAAAQHAADTRDADGDGIYCEDLPCPCAKPGQTNSPSSPSGTPTSHRSKLGRPVLLGRRSKATNCHVRGALPDPACTPGAYFPGATRKVICRSGYSSTVRKVSTTVKARVYAEYGITKHRRGQYEVDHLVPLEGGGSNSIANLFPEAASPRPGFHEKDRLENMMRERICGGANQRALQRRIARGWVSLFHDLVG